MRFTLTAEVHEALDQGLLAWRPHTALLPTLEDLICLPHLATFRLFACPSITTLNVRLPSRLEKMTTSQASFFSSLPGSVPCLSQLRIDIELSPQFDTESDEFKITIPAALSELKRLRRIVLHPSWLTSRVAKALACLPELAILDTSSVWDGEDGEDIATRPSPTDLLALNDFPSLDKLCIVVSLKDALSWVQKCSTHSLPRFSVWSPQLETKEAFKHLIDYVSRNMSSRMEYLGISADHPLEVAPSPPPATIQITDLQPLLAFQKLEALELHFTFPFDLHVEDVILIVESLPFLTSLILNPSPPLSLGRPSSLHLSCLTNLARSSCHSLKTLGLYLDTSVGLLEEAEGVTLNNLENLSLGSSPLLSLSAGAIARYIYRIMPEGSRVAVWQTFPEANDAFEESWQIVSDLLDQWDGPTVCFL
ncbi:hypothetical protein ONZ45_g11032 [Pleurotus djamor]|nr:hypothetical protein ONZ45_g11032 [Pleurotus djamor]